MAVLSPKLTGPFITVLISLTPTRLGQCARRPSSAFQKTIIALQKVTATRQPTALMQLRLQLGPTIV